jgi:hypothetical protein
MAKPDMSMEPKMICSEIVIQVDFRISKTFSIYKSKCSKAVYFSVTAQFAKYVFSAREAK